MSSFSMNDEVHTGFAPWHHLSALMYFAQAGAGGNPVIGVSQAGENRLI
jgi:hypothetical protein